ncbi:hypothetical protein Tcan_11289 [Toxocara canis]|uniref:Uncharacterized protein n=1 Tax=Toxocara canis TaxID=6265 RepID=A0A0B2UVX5_TOXCA|nr:hypothetical protein Tcan_11289 [Toxocara canis]
MHESSLLCEAGPSSDSRVSPDDFLHRKGSANEKCDERKPLTPPFCREDCMGVLSRFNYMCCVFARILSTNPLQVEDSSGQINLGESPTRHCKVGDYCYLLVDTCFIPPRCVRLTVVPGCLKPVAQYQLQLARGRAATQTNEVDEISGEDSQQMEQDEEE